MKSTLLRTLVALVAGSLLGTSASASEQLAQKNNCMTCHAADAQRVGPSWASIRGKYKDGTVNAAQLAKNIKAGSTGKWGSIPMPPQPTVSDGDAQALAAWILAGK